MEFPRVHINWEKTVTANAATSNVVTSNQETRTSKPQCYSWQHQKAGQVYDWIILIFIYKATYGVKFDVIVFDVPIFWSPCFRCYDVWCYRLLTINSPQKGSSPHPIRSKTNWVFIHSSKWLPQYGFGEKEWKNRVREGQVKKLGGKLHKQW